MRSAAGAFDEELVLSGGSSSDEDARGAVEELSRMLHGARLEAGGRELTDRCVDGRTTNCLSTHALTLTAPLAAAPTQELGRGGTAQLQHGGCSGRTVRLLSGVESPACRRWCTQAYGPQP
jgi:hypothetical protein